MNTKAVLKEFDGEFFDFGFGDFSHAHFRHAPKPKQLHG